MKLENQSSDIKSDFAIGNIIIDQFDSYGAIDFASILQVINFKIKCLRSLDPVWKQECESENPYTHFHSIYKEYVKILKTVELRQNELILKMINDIPDQGLEWQDKKLSGINAKIINDIKISPKTPINVVFDDGSKLLISN